MLQFLLITLILPPSVANSKPGGITIIDLKVFEVETKTLITMAISYLKSWLTLENYIII